MAVIYRYKCRECEKTFRYYPNDVDRSGFTCSIRYLAVILSAMGLSSRKIKDIFNKFGITLSHMTIWREGQELAKNYDNSIKLNLSTEAHIEKETILNAKSYHNIVLAIDFGDGKYMLLGTLNESNPSTALSLLRPMLTDTGIKAIAIDKSHLDLRKLQPLKYLTHP
jgi:transposase-like protein